MIRFPILFLALILASSAHAAHADDAPSDPWYQVEVIVFEHTRAVSTTPGDWQAEVGAPALARALELLPAVHPRPDTDPDVDRDTAIDPAFDPGADLDAAPAESDGEILPPGIPVHGSGAAAFRLVDDRELQMAAVMNRLRVASAYTPLLHVAWLQPATTRADFGGVRIHTGLGAATDDGEGDADDPGAQALAAEDADGGEPGASEAPDPGSLDHEGPHPPAAAAVELVEGVVRLSRGRFLHLNVDLLYRRPGMAPARDAGLFSFLATPRLQTEVLRLTQSRRVRADELQYIDHPRFGTIVLVTPFAPLPEADREARAPAFPPPGPLSDLRVVAQGMSE